MPEKPLKKSRKNKKKDGIALDIFSKTWYNSKCVLQDRKDFAYNLPRDVARLVTRDA